MWMSYGRNEEYSLVSPIMWHFGYEFVNLFYLFGFVYHFYLQQMSIDPLTEVQCVWSINKEILYKMTRVFCLLNNLELES